MDFHGTLQGIASLFYMWTMLVPQRIQIYGPPWPVTGDGFTFSYVDYVSTSQETHVWTSAARYVNSFTSLYIDDVRTSQETWLWTFMACYGWLYFFICR
jgi:hypothetical protein